MASHGLRSFGGGQEDVRGLRLLDSRQPGAAITRRPKRRIPTTFVLRVLWRSFPEQLATAQNSKDILRIIRRVAISKASSRAVFVSRRRHHIHEV
jgi:hypothetical protein